jgi:hypothetical protein
VTARLALALAVAAALVPWSLGRLDGALGPHRAQEEVLYLWTGDQVKRVFPGFEAIAADLYWLRTVQYYGGQRRFAEGKDFTLLRPLIDITTTLDPRLEVAYRYGAVFLAERAPEGAGRPLEAVEVLERGVRNNPRSWRLRQDLGFFHYLFLRDAHRASQVLLEAAELPGAAFWLRTLAADILAKGGDRRSSRVMWQQMYEQAEEGIIRENARERLRVIDSFERAEALGAAVTEFARRHGRGPERLEELRRAGLWEGPLADLAGVPFGYDVETGRVFVQQASPMWRPD